MEEYDEKLANLNRPEENVRGHPDEQIEELVKSVENFGQLRDIIIDENNTILAGNGLFIALKKLGWEEASVKKFKDLSENDKKKVMLADNMIFELGNNKSDVIDKYVEDLAEDRDFEIPGFDKSILEDLYSSDEEIEDKMDDFGKLSDDEVDKLKEAKDNQAETSSDEPSDTGGEIKLTNEDIEVKRNEQGQKVPTIECPNCGEEIEL